MSSSIEITSTTLNADDLKRIHECLVYLQGFLDRNNIPGALIYAEVKGGLSVALDETQFRLALSKAVSTGRLPGIESHLGRSGGFGPVKGTVRSAVVVSKPIAAKPSAVVLIPLAEPPAPKKAIPTITAVVKPPAPIKPVETPRLADIMASNVPVEEVEEAVEEKESTKEAPTENPVPVLTAISIKPGSIWNPDQAKVFIYAFADLASPKEQQLLRARAEEASKNEAATRAIFRVALGWDPGVKANPFVNWAELFDAPEEIK